MPFASVLRDVGAVLALVAALAVPAAGRAAGPRDLVVEAAGAETTVVVRPSSLRVVALLDRADATYAGGETLRLGVRTNEDAFVTVFNIGASGRVTQLFPNAFQTDNRVRAGAVVEIPSPDSGAAIRVAPPFGREELRIVATTKPVAVLPDGRLGERSGLFATVRGGLAALNRDLQVVADAADDGVKVAVVAVGLRTVAVGPSGGSAPFVPVVVPARPTALTLLVAADRKTYRVGDPVTLSATVLEPCRLRMVATDARGRSRRIVPSAAVGDGRLTSAQTVIVAGGPAPQSLTFRTPGPAVVTALCTALDDEADDERGGGETMSGGEKAAFDRDVTLAEKRADPRVGLARLVLAIRP